MSRIDFVNFDKETACFHRLSKGKPFDKRSEINITIIIIVYERGAGL